MAKNLLHHFFASVDLYNMFFVIQHCISMCEVPILIHELPTWPQYWSWPLCSGTWEDMGTPYWLVGAGHVYCTWEDMGTPYWLVGAGHVCTVPGRIWAPHTGWWGLVAWSVHCGRLTCTKNSHRAYCSTSTYTTVLASVVDTNILNLDPDPESWPNLDPGSRYAINFKRKMLKNCLYKII